MKKFQNRNINIPLDFFDYDVEVVFTKNIQNYVDKRPSVFNGIVLDDIEAVCFRIKRTAIVLLPNNSRLSLVVHEVSHAVDNILNANALDDGEIRAMLNEYIIKKIYGE